MRMMFGIIVLVAARTRCTRLVWAMGAYSAVSGILLVGLSLRLDSASPRVGGSARELRPDGRLVLTTRPYGPATSGGSASGPRALMLPRSRSALKID